MAELAAIEKLAEDLHWLGHDCFRLDRPEGPIYFDPYEISEGPAASLVLISHDHFDHNSPDDLAKVSGPDTVIVTEKDSAAKLRGDVRVMAPGESLAVGGVKVEAMPAYNLGKDFHPKGKNWLGFIVTVDGVRIYHAGDTDYIPEMEVLRVDLALLPVSGTYVMDAEEAISAAQVIGPKLAIPMHYGAIVGDENDAKKFAEALQDMMVVRILPKEG